MKYLVIAFLTGFVVGYFLFYLWKRSRNVGKLRIYELDGDTDIFLELEKELEDVKNRGYITLRVESSAYYENQNS